jgi:hypothetical protein
MSKNKPKKPSIGPKIITKLPPKQDAPSSSNNVEEEKKEI